MKRIALCALCMILVGFYWGIGVCAPPSAKAHGRYGESLDAVLEDIRKSQGISGNEAIDCGKVTNEQFEALGEAVMGIMHPDTEEHDLMDRMMGGEGSETLAATHRIMGARYLGCCDNGPFEGMGPGTRGGWMMGAGPGRGWGGMRGYGFGRGWMHYGWGGIIMWIVILVIVIAVLYFIYYVAKSKAPGAPSGETPLDLLKKRYARGEITKEEYQRIKKDLET
ncbi:MAG: SHOCT domain-containing protein [bacterium]